MSMLRFALFISFQFFFMLSLSAADTDFMRSIGKIYVVVGVMLLLFLGIVFYLILLDRRLTKFENQIKSDE
jgi:hypothetical protein